METDETLTSSVAGASPAASGKKSEALVTDQASKGIN